MKRNFALPCVPIVAVALAGCQSVERSISGRPVMERPAEVVYRFDNVKRSPAVNEWDNIRRILYVHALGSVDIAEANLRRYDQNDLRDYTARFTIPDLSHIAKINEEVDALAAQSINGEKLRYALARADITFSGDNLSTPNDCTLRGVTIPAATVRLFPTATPVETTADQYGAWAKRVSVAPGQDSVYGYAESFPTPGRPATRRYFKINVFTMKQEDVTAREFDSRPKR